MNVKFRRKVIMLCANMKQILRHATIHQIYIIGSNLQF